MGNIFDALQKSEKEKNMSIFEDARKIAKNSYTNTTKGNTGVQYDVSPAKKRVTGNKILSQPEEKSLIADQFRILRTHVLQKCREKNFKSILVTSAAPNEGKTTIAINLAISIAQCIDKKTILLDFDLRKSTVGSLFNINGKAGILEYLNNDMELSNIVHSADKNNILIIPSGKSDKHPSDIVSAETVDHFLSELRLAYSDHFIVVDSTPVDLTPEVNIMADRVDAVLFVIAAGKTKRDQISNAFNKIDKNKIIGITINKIDTRFSYYHSYYKNYYKSYSDI